MYDKEISTTIPEQTEIINLTNNTQNDYKEFSLRAMQLNILNELKYSPYWIINAPMASGKTLAQCFLAKLKQKINPNLKVVISCPQKSITNGFAKQVKTIFEQDVLIYSVDLDLSKNNSDKSEELYEFLCSNRQNQVAICCHATLVGTLTKKVSVDDEDEEKQPIITDEIKDILKDVLIIIDEAHHIYTQKNEILDNIECNGLGAVVAYALKNKDKNIEIGLATATFHRGDRRPILTEEMRKEFKLFKYSYEQYFIDSGMKSFRYDVKFYDNRDCSNSIKEIFQGDGNEKIKTIVFTPNVNSTASVSREEDYLQVYRGVSGNNNIDVGNEYNPITTINHINGQELKVVNLAKRKDRTAEQKIIERAHENIQNGDDIDCIVSLNMFIEGDSWRWATREIIINFRGSLTVVVQMIGRLFREAPGKTHIDIYQLINYSLENLTDEKETTKNKVNNCFKAVFGCMVIENLFKPIKFKEKRKRENNGDGNIEGTNRNPIAELIPEIDEQKEFKEDVFKNVISAISENEEIKNDKKELRKTFEESVKQELEVRDFSQEVIEENYEDLAHQIMLMHTRETMKVKGINLNDIDYNVMIEKENINTLGWINHYTSGIRPGEITFKELKEAFCGEDSEEKGLKIIEEICKIIKEKDPNYMDPFLAKSYAEIFGYKTYFWNWIHQRIAAKNGKSTCMFYKSYSKKAEEYEIPYLFESKSEKETRKLQFLTDKYDDPRDIPRKTEEGKTHIYYQWIINSKDKPLSQKIINILSKKPNWINIFNKIDRKQLTLNKVCVLFEWIENHNGKLPSKYSKNKEEKYFNIFIRDLKTAKKEYPKKPRNGYVWYSEIENMLKEHQNVPQDLFEKKR